MRKEPQAEACGLSGLSWTPQPAARAEPCHGAQKDGVRSPAGCCVEGLLAPWASTQPLPGAPVGTLSPSSEPMEAEAGAKAQSHTIGAPVPCSAGPPPSASPPQPGNPELWPDGAP